MIVAAAAQGVLDGDALGDGDVFGQPADIGEAPRPEVDGLIIGITGKIEAVRATRVPDREHHLIAGTVDFEESRPELELKP